MLDNGVVDKRSRVYVWSGSALAVAGLGVALVGWVGLNRANQYLGVPAAIAALLGLALSVYGVFMQQPGQDVKQVFQRSETGGSILMIGQADRTEHPSVSQIISAAKISGDSTMIGQVDGDVEFREKS